MKATIAELVDKSKVDIIIGIGIGMDIGTTRAPWSAGSERRVLRCPAAQVPRVRCRSFHGYLTAEDPTNHFVIPILSVVLIHRYISKQCHFLGVSLPYPLAV